MLDSFNKGKVWIGPDRVTVEQSKPLYPKKESGVCLVVGTAPCSDADVDAAMLLYPKADFCAVNEACALVPAHHLATAHGEKIEKFIDLHERTWGIAGDDYELPTLHLRDIAEATTERPCYRWPITAGAGSAPFAAAAMALIGYDLIIFCGCPMIGGDGYALKDTHPHTPADPRFGCLPPGHGMVKLWQSQLVAMREQHPEICAKFRSMSGYTQEIFGAPTGQEVSNDACSR